MTLNDFCEVEYGGNFDAMMEEVMFDSVVPAICINKDCEYIDELEPDARKCLCPECETNTVFSVVELIMAGGF